MKVDEFVEYLEIVHESGGDLDIETQGKMIAIIERQRAALKLIANTAQGIARAELDKEV